jgi:hypothetical protein
VSLLLEKVDIVGGICHPLSWLLCELMRASHGSSTTEGLQAAAVRVLSTSIFQEPDVVELIEACYQHANASRDHMLVSRQNHNA